ncbi:MAG: MaoC family dehydratase [Acidobacteria bacterium]|nr:MaoC family dehydratase [Acidobacteriota bacterium]
MTEIEGVEKLGLLVGQEAGLSEWVGVSQERIHSFAEATEDRQWIHTDPERAARESPFRVTVAHGFLTLSLLSEMGRTAVAVGGVRMGINYGLNRVRFVAPVPSGSRVRGRFKLAALEEIKGGVQATWDVTVEREGGGKPCCTAVWLVRYYV